MEAELAVLALSRSERRPRPHPALPDGEQDWRAKRNPSDDFLGRAIDVEDSMQVAETEIAKR